MAVSVRYGHPVAVLMIDLDHFKQINDTQGHDAGDRALAFIARALQAAVRPGDLVGRYGGEEFCVLMTHADNAAANAFDVRMRGYLTEVAERELGFALAYSAGIAMRSSPDDTLAAMVRRADATLYSAKEQGRVAHARRAGVAVAVELTVRRRPRGATATAPGAARESRSTRAARLPRACEDGPARGGIWRR